MTARINTTNVPSEEIRDHIKTAIDQTEKSIINILSLYKLSAQKNYFETTNSLAKIITNMKRMVAQYYLEYALTTTGQESVLYILKAIDLEPKIKPHTQIIIPKTKVIIQTNEEFSDLEYTKVTNYIIQRDEDKVRVINQELDRLKEKILEDPTILEAQEFLYNLIEKNDFPDIMLYNELTELKDDDWEERKISLLEKSKGKGREIAKMLIRKEDEKRTKKRWMEGKKLTPPTKETLEKILSKNYPQHVIINEEALGGVFFEKVKNYLKIDDVCENIFQEIVARLPKKLNAYDFGQFETKEVLNIHSIGNIEVDLAQTTGKIFTYIRCVQGKDFVIWNNRKSGRKYLNEQWDLSRPKTIIISSQKVNLKLDGSQKEATINKASEWLKQNVLEKIIYASKKQIHPKKRNRTESFPKEIGPIYTWVSAKKAEKISLTNSDPQKVYPHEIIAISPRMRLVPFGAKEGVPKEAHWAYIWCGIGKCNSNDPPENYMPKELISDYDEFDFRSYLVQIEPKTAKDIFIVDYKVWDDFREEVFEDSDVLSQNQYEELLLRLSKTLKPINEYKGEYKKPIVLIGRDVELDETRIVLGVTIE